MGLNVLRCRADIVGTRGGRPGLPVPNSPYGLCGRKATPNSLRAQELCKSHGGRPGIPVPNSAYGLCGCKATLNRSSVRVEVDVLGSLSLILLMVSVDVKQHWTGAVWMSRWRPGLPVPNSPYGLCGRKATLNSKLSFLMRGKKEGLLADERGVYLPRKHFLKRD